MKTTTTITIDVNVLKDLKIYCVMNDLRVSDFIGNAVKEKLEKEKREED